ncbi:hypothetical protein AX16_009312 [Volvariella volvacea WC 439]|nr:hypothetical protein AX16_009312 [Volvariella volvacea WC 439]
MSPIFRHRKSEPTTCSTGWMHRHVHNPTAAPLPSILNTISQHLSLKARAVHWLNLSEPARSNYAKTPNPSTILVQRGIDANADLEFEDSDVGLPESGITRRSSPVYIHTDPLPECGSFPPSYSYSPYCDQMPWSIAPKPHTNDFPDGSEIEPHSSLNDDEDQILPVTGLLRVDVNSSQSYSTLPKDYFAPASARGGNKLRKTRSANYERYTSLQ